MRPTLVTIAKHRCQAKNLTLAHRVCSTGLGWNENQEPFGRNNKINSALKQHVVLADMSLARAYNKPKLTTKCTHAKLRQSWNVKCQWEIAAALLLGAC